MANNNVPYDLTNLMIPAFGAVRMMTNTFNPINGYELSVNTLVIDQVPFRPQSVTIDASAVPAGQNVTFLIKQINYRKIVQGGNTLTFNFPSIPNMVFSVLPDDGSSTVESFFYNFPSFPDTEVQAVSSGGGTIQDVNIVGAVATVPVGFDPAFNVVKIDPLSNVVKIDPSQSKVNQGAYIDTYLNQEVLISSTQINIGAGGGLPATNTLIAASVGNRFIVLDISISYFNLTFNNPFIHYVNYPGARLAQEVIQAGTPNKTNTYNPNTPMVTAQNVTLSLNSEVTAAVTSSTAGYIRTLTRYILAP